MMRRISAKVTKKFCARTARASHGIIAPSTKCANFIKQSYGIHPDKIGVIPYGLEDRFLRNDRVLCRSSEQVQLLFVGNYIPLKGTPILENLLPTIAKKFPQVNISFVVQPEAVEHVRSLYVPYFGDRVTVNGWMEHDKLSSIYSSHDIFLFPSFFEGFGKTFLEAMGGGMCVIGFDEGGLSDLAAFGKEAFYCETGDYESFQNLLERCLHEPSLARGVGKNAHELARRYTWNVTAEETEKFILNLKNRFMK